LQEGFNEMTSQHTAAAAAQPAQNQMDLFGPIMRMYEAGVPVSNDSLYRNLRQAEAIPRQAVRSPIGRAGDLHDPVTRRVRWYQQTLRALGLIERVPDARGVWRATEKGRSRPELTPAPARVRMLGFSTDLGIALWGEATDTFKRLDEPVHLVLSSLPYPLARPRAYGGPREDEYTEFVTRLLEPIVATLAPGGIIALSVSNDCFLPHSPARSLYREKMVIALNERLGLSKLDELIWVDKSKPPGPIQWASLKRVHLNTGYEVVYTFTNAPDLVRSNNQRVLQPHSERQKKLIAAGGENRRTSYGDGAHRLRQGAYSNATAGRIPKNVLEFGHRCHSQDAARKAAQAVGLPVHGATMPLSLARFLVDFLSEKGDLVADMCAGWFTSALAAQQGGRRWLATEKMLEYVLGASYRFEQSPGFERHLAV
jgi:DNA modification methylase